MLKKLKSLIGIGFVSFLLLAAVPVFAGTQFLSFSKNLPKFHAYWMELSHDYHKTDNKAEAKISTVGGGYTVDLRIHDMKTDAVVSGRFNDLKKGTAKFTVDHSAKREPWHFSKRHNSSNIPC